MSIKTVVSADQNIKNEEKHMIENNKKASKKISLSNSNSSQKSALKKNKKKVGFDWTTELRDLVARLYSRKISIYQQLKPSSDREDHHPSSLWWLLWLPVDSVRRVAQGNQY